MLECRLSSQYLSPSLALTLQVGRQRAVSYVAPGGCRGRSSECKIQTDEEYSPKLKSETRPRLADFAIGRNFSTVLTRQEVKVFL